MRILVLGTSQALALRAAFPAIRAQRPDIELAFWGLPGASFHRTAIAADGLLRPDPDDLAGRKLSAQWNGAEAVDLTQFDRIFLVGLRYGLQPVLRMAAALQPAEWGDRPGARLVSEAFLGAAIQARIAETLDSQSRRTPLDGRFLFMPAPYPAERAARATGPQAEPALRQACQLSAAARVMALFEELLAQAHAALGVGFAPQPRETLAAPFLTRDVHLDDPARDARHMNSTYGQLALTGLLAALSQHSAAAAAATTA